MVGRHIHPGIPWREAYREVYPRWCTWEAYREVYPRWCIYPGCTWEAWWYIPRVYMGGMVGIPGW